MKDLWQGYSQKKGQGEPRHSKVRFAKSKKLGRSKTNYQEGMRGGGGGERSFV